MKYRVGDIVRSEGGYCSNRKGVVTKIINDTDIIVRFEGRSGGTYKKTHNIKLVNYTKTKLYEVLNYGN